MDQAVTTRRRLLTGDMLFKPGYPRLTSLVVTAGHRTVTFLGQDGRRGQSTFVDMVSWSPSGWMVL